MTVTLCDSGAVKLKAGTNVSTSLTDANYTTLINQAEAAIAVETAHDWVTDYSGLSANFKTILEDAASSHAAIAAANYDATGYTTKTEFQNIVNINYARYKDAINLIKNDRERDFLLGT